MINCFEYHILKFLLLSIHRNLIKKFSQMKNIFLIKNNFNNFIKISLENTNRIFLNRIFILLNFIKVFFYLYIIELLKIYIHHFNFYFSLGKLTLYFKTKQFSNFLQKEFFFISLVIILLSRNIVNCHNKKERNFLMKVFK